MLRAAVLIGVSKAGTLPQLQAVEAGIDRMRKWATGQGIVDERLVVLTDQDQPLRAYQVADAIAALVKRRDLDQLIVYFSGHGIWNQSERWLLSGAPDQASEAVNVDGSIQLARYCGINHVVLIADACRTAAQGVQGLSITGTEIFPNTPVDGIERAVDVFFACARGKPALEITLAASPEEQTFGLYTDILAACLQGDYTEVREPGTLEEAPVDFVRAWTLQDALAARVPKRLQDALKKIPTVNQMPVARFGSRNAWISSLPRSLASLPRGPFDTIVHRGGPGPSAPASSKVPGVVDALFAILADILGGRADKLAASGSGATSIEKGLRVDIHGLMKSMRTGPFPMRCGLSVQGARIAAVTGRAHGSAAIRLLDRSKGLVQVDTGQAASVLVELAGGASVVMPVIPGFVASMVFQDAELAHVSYEPTATIESGEDAGIRRGLSAAFGVVAGLGVLQLNEANILWLFDTYLRKFLHADPALGLYYAYVCQDAGLREGIENVRQALSEVSDGSFFDIALLSGQLREGKTPQHTVPPFPLFSRGWSLLNAFGVAPRFEGSRLREHLRPSLWSLYDAEATKELRTIFNQPGE